MTFHATVAAHPTAAFHYTVAVAVTASAIGAFTEAVIIGVHTACSALTSTSEYKHASDYLSGIIPQNCVGFNRHLLLGHCSVINNASEPHNTQ